MENAANLDYDVKKAVPGTKIPGVCHFKTESAENGEVKKVIPKKTAAEE